MVQIVKNIQTAMNGYLSPHNLQCILSNNRNRTSKYGGDWDARLYISHYHAGLWVVDIETLKPSDPSDRVAHMQKQQ